MHGETRVCHCSERFRGNLMTMTDLTVGTSVTAAYLGSLSSLQLMLMVG